MPQAEKGETKRCDICQRKFSRGQRCVTLIIKDDTDSMIVSTKPIVPEVGIGVWYHQWCFNRKILKAMIEARKAIRKEGSGAFR